MTRLSSACAGIGMAVCAVAGGRVWLRYDVRDPLLGPEMRTATGYAAAPALSACGVLALAAVLLVLLTRRRTRGAGLVALSCAAVGGFGVSVLLLLDPSAAVPAAVTGAEVSTGAGAVTGARSTWWAWVYLCGAVLVCAGPVLFLVSSRRPGWPSPQPGEGPDPGGVGEGEQDPAASAERQRRANAATWRDLSEGRDPTY